MAERTFEFHRSSSERETLLHSIADHVLETQSLSGLFNDFAAPVLSIMRGDLLSLSFHHHHQDKMFTSYWKSDRQRGDLGTFSINDSAVGWAWKCQEPVTIPDTECERRFIDCAPVLFQHGVRAYTVLPVIENSEGLGALGVGRAALQILESEEMEFLSRVVLAALLARVRQDSRWAEERRLSLFRISRDLSASLSTEGLMSAVLFNVRNIARYRTVELFLLDENRRNLHPYRHGGAESLGEHLIPVHESVSEQAILSRAAIFLDGHALQNIDKPSAAILLEKRIQSFCSVPLIAGDRVWGTLDVNSAVENAFGASDAEYLQQAANYMGTALQNASSAREVERLKAQVARGDRDLNYEVQATTAVDEIVGKSHPLKRALALASTVADSDSTVLITGETGTGKELISRAIHRMSKRRDRKFIKVNCAAIPSGLLESELFGHEKGAFTGAVGQKVGRLELADKGTLLLDEVGEIPLELQPKLLRVLQDHEFERLGGTKTIRVDVRLIAATNRDLSQAVREKEFRADLYYRLHVFPIHMPSLRERSDDLSRLVRYFVERSAARLHKHIDLIPDEAMDAMLKWHWPGNIRELENFIERSVILSRGNRLEIPFAELKEESVAAFDDTLLGKEREHIVRVLRECHGLLSGPRGASARLGLKRTTLQYKMQRFGILREDYLR